MNSKKRHGLFRPYFEKKASKKRRLRGKKEAPDRISSLPDHVLCHILSFLPTKYAVGTRVLSTRWKNLFLSVPVLDFDDSLTNTKSSFSNFVRRVLSLHDVTCVPKFSLKCVNFSYELSDVCSWISAAIVRNVQELEVAACFVRGVTLPRELLECESLLVLKIRGEFEIPLSGSVCLPCLKTLHLDSLSLGLADTTWRIFSHFPTLENLFLKCFRTSGKVLDISIPSLKRLELIEIRDFSRIVLNAPALEHLNYKSNADKGFSGSGMNSLVKAHVAIQTCKVSAEFPNFVNMLHNVQFLTLSSFTLNGIRRDSFPTFHNLIRLELTGRHFLVWHEVSNLLESSPFLQYLVFADGLPSIFPTIKFPEHGLYYEFDSDVDIEEHLCLSLHTKEIEIKNFRGACDAYKICEYFLKKAKVLGKLIVHSFEVEQRLEIRQKLLSYPRSSMTCQVDVY